MGFGTLQRNRYPVNVITSRYYYTGKLEPKGPFGIWMNDVQFTAIALLELNGAAFDAGSRIDTIARDELLLPKVDIVAVDLLSAEARQSVSYLRSVQKAVFYTERFVFNASVATTAETRMDQLLDMIKGDFFPLLNVEMFPLHAVRPQVFRTSEMVLLNRARVTSYHAL